MVKSHYTNGSKRIGEGGEPVSRSPGSGQIKSKRRMSGLSSLPFRRQIMAVLILACIGLLSFLSISMFVIASKNISSIGMRLSEQNASNACTQMENYFDQINGNSAQFIRMRSLREIIKADDAEQIPDSAPDNLKDDILGFVNYSKSVAQIDYTMVSVYCKNGFFYSTLPSMRMPFTDFESCVKYYQMNDYLRGSYGKATGCHLIETPLPNGDLQYSFVFLRPLYSPSTYHLAGVLLASVSERSISRQYSEYNSDAYLIHKNGIVISAGNKQLLNRPVSINLDLVQSMLASRKPEGTLIYGDDRSRMLSWRRVSNGDAYIVVPFQPYQGINRSENRQITIAFISISLAGILFSILMAQMLSRRLMHSVQGVIELAQRIEHGDRSARYDSDQSNEIAAIGNCINNMLNQIDCEEKKHQEHEKNKQMLEIQLLQSQINPHLLYNSLNSVAFMLQNGQSHLAQDILDAMSRFFKKSLSRGNDIITLEEELEIVKSYIDVQCLARGKQFHLEVCLDVVPENLRLPKFTIQPIVENAVLHGFLAFRDNGTIRITGEKSGRRLILRVCDDGIGIEPDQLQMLNDSLLTGMLPEKNSSFGLYNINLRLRNMFGPECGLYLESDVGEGTTVVITISPKEN